MKVNLHIVVHVRSWANVVVKSLIQMLQMRHVCVLVLLEDILSAWKLAIVFVGHIAIRAIFVDQDHLVRHAREE